ncbi:hypothetical protein FRC16_010036, partial [Serendipita sp. 398]
MSYLSIATNFVLGPVDANAPESGGKKMLVQVTLCDWRGQTGKESFPSFVQVLSRPFLVPPSLVLLWLSATWLILYNKHEINILLDVYVTPTDTVTDYCTTTHGLDARHLLPPAAVPFSTAKANVAELLRDHILVGHALWTSLALLELTHPAVLTRDVATYSAFRERLGYDSSAGSPSSWAYPPLKDLVRVIMRRDMEPLFVNT